ncbi:hypothetical protein PI124_g24840, partial [Phytophthora idaei]
MRQEMNRLENKLEAEIKKRIEMNKSLQNYCDEQVAQMTAALEKLLSDRAKQVDDRLDILSQEIEAHRVHGFVRGRTTATYNQEAMILKRLSDHEHATAESFERERHDREL